MQKGGFGFFGGFRCANVAGNAYLCLSGPIFRNDETTFGSTVPVPVAGGGVVRPPPECSGRGNDGRAACGLSSGHCALAPGTRRAARMAPLALLGPLRFHRHAVFAPCRPGADVRILCALHRPDLGPSGGWRRHGYAHAAGFDVASHARLLHDAGRTGSPRSQFAASQRRILHSGAGGAAPGSVVRRV